MATISMTTDIDVVSKYKELINVSLDGDSIYIRTKETLDSLMNDRLIDDKDKAQVITQVLGNLTSSITQSSMNTAIQWAAQEKELYLKKLEMEKQLDILTQEIKIKEAQATKISNDDLISQATSLRQNGHITSVNGTVTSLSDSGKTFQEIKLLEEETTNKIEDRNVIQANEKQIYANINKVVADTYVNYGMYNGYSIGETGLAGVTNNTPAGYDTLSDLQAIIAKEQAKGYAYNAWSNAASGLGATIGTALTSEIDIFGGATYSTLLSDWSTVISKLKDTNAPTF